MNVRFFGCTLIGLLFTLSCGKDCESSQIGSVNLLTNSLEFDLYEDGEILSFANDASDTLHFEISKSIISGQLCVNYLCENTSDPFLGPNCEFYAGQNISTTFHCTNDESLLIQTLVWVENYEEESTLFYDIFRINGNHQNSFTSAYHAINPHFTSPSFDESQIFFEPLIAVESQVLINGIMYENVIKTEEGNLELVYQLKDGLIIIKTNGSYYVKV